MNVPDRILLRIVVLIYSTDRWYAEGIVSSGYECARPHAYGLYTRIATDKEWVVETILKSGFKKPYI